MGTIHRMQFHPEGEVLLSSSNPLLLSPGLDVVQAPGPGSRKVPARDDYNR